MRFVSQSPMPPGNLYKIKKTSSAVFYGKTKSFGITAVILKTRCPGIYILKKGAVIPSHGLSYVNVRLLLLQIGVYPNDATSRSSLITHVYISKTISYPFFHYKGNLYMLLLLLPHSFFCYNSHTTPDFAPVFNYFDVNCND